MLCPWCDLLVLIEVVWGGGGGSLPDKMSRKGLGYIVRLGRIHCGCIWDKLCYICAVAQCGNLKQVNRGTHQHQQR